MHNYELIFHMVGGRTLKVSALSRKETFTELISLMDSAGWYLFDENDGAGVIRINPANVLYINIRVVEAKDGRS